MISLSALAMACMAGPAQADKVNDDLRAFVNHTGIRAHLNALQGIADQYGGNRWVGTPADAATRNYIVSQLQAAGFNVQRLPVVFENFHELTPAVLAMVAPQSKAYAEGDPGAPDAQFHITQNSGNGDVTAALQAVDIQIPPGATANSSTSGCQLEDFNQFVPGSIALIQRGGCLFDDKVNNAIAKGAAGVILFNEGQPGRTGLIGSFVSTPVGIPVVLADFAVGQELYNLTTQGTVQVHLKTEAEFVHTETENIIAETPSGLTEHVVMLGAHLDSVEEGPGINDNGSAVGTLLEIARGIHDLGIRPLNRIRLAFWGAEEEGQVGSTQYVNGLTKTQAKNISFYLNADMLGSPNFVPSVYDADASNLPFIVPGPKAANGSTKIEKTLVDYFKSVGAPPTLLAIDQRSDYKAFLFAGIPFAAITSGFDAKKTAAEAAIFGGTAGAPYDSCYHQACDTIDNVSDTSLDLMAGALVYTMMKFANEK